MSDDPIGDAARAARRRRKVPEGAACLFCGEQDPVASSKSTERSSKSITSRAWAT